MTPWVSLTAGLRRIARRRRPSFLMRRARRPRHRRRLRRGKRLARHAPTRIGQDGARPSASKSARLARSAPAGNEKPRFVDEDVATLNDQDRWPAVDDTCDRRPPERHRSRPTMPRGQMRIALRFQQVQSRSRAACSTDAIHAHLLLSLPTSLNADEREPICPASALAHTRSCRWWFGPRMAESAPFSLRANHLLLLTRQ
jgi:hypothetical protein